MLSLLRESDAALPAADNGRLQAEPRLSRSSVWRDGIMKSDFTPVITGTEAHLPCFLFVYIFFCDHLCTPAWLALAGRVRRAFGSHSVGHKRSGSKTAGCELCSSRWFLVSLCMHVSKCVAWASNDSVPTSPKFSVSCEGVS